MSDFDAIMNDDHSCSEACLPHVPTELRDLEKLDESHHIDVLYTSLNLVREHAALLLLRAARADPNMLVPLRSLAVLLNMDEAAMKADLSPDHPIPLRQALHYVTAKGGGQGYAADAMAVLFQIQMATQG